MGTAKKEDAKTSLQKIQMMQEQYLLENSLTNYWTTGNSCNDKTNEIKNTLFSGDNALNDKDYYFCIMPFESNGFKLRLFQKDGTNFGLTIKTIITGKILFEKLFYLLLIISLVGCTNAMKKI